MMLNMVVSRTAEPFMTVVHSVWGRRIDCCEMGGGGGGPIDCCAHKASRSTLHMLLRTMFWPRAGEELTTSTRLGF